MKFAKYLASDLVSEWKTKYIHYKKLKRLVADCYVEQQSLTQQDNEEPNQEYEHSTANEQDEETDEEQEEEEEEEQEQRPYTAPQTTISKRRQRRISSAGDIRTPNSKYNTPYRSMK
jgi:hypothetical protein